MVAINCAPLPMPESCTRSPRNPNGAIGVRLSGDRGSSMVLPIETLLLDSPAIRLAESNSTLGPGGAVGALFV